MRAFGSSTFRRCLHNINRACKHRGNSATCPVGASCSACVATQCHMTCMAAMPLRPCTAQRGSAVADLVRQLLAKACSTCQCASGITWPGVAVVLIVGVDGVGGDARVPGVAIHPSPRAKLNRVWGASQSLRRHVEWAPLSVPDSDVVAVQIGMHKVLIDPVSWQHTGFSLLCCWHMSPWFIVGIRCPAWYATFFTLTRCWCDRFTCIMLYTSSTETSWGFAVVQLLRLCSPGQAWLLQNMTSLVSQRCSRTLLALHRRRLITKANR